MGRLTFTLDTEQLSSGGEDIKQLAEDIQAFINILQRQLDEQMKQYKPIDPREQMQEKLDEMCPYKLEATDLAHLYADLKSEIGEAMGPVSYAAYALATKLDEANLSCKWVWDFVKYYEEHWEF